MDILTGVLVILFIIYFVWCTRKFKKDLNELKRLDGLIQELKENYEASDKSNS